MKKIINGAILVILFISAVGNVSAHDSGQPVIELSKQVWDFGTITEGEIVRGQVWIKNVGSKTLKISDVNTSCGCTVPELSSKVIAPGKTSELKVIFNSQGRKGRVEKHVEIESNDPKNSKITFTVTGYIIKKVEKTTPVVQRTPDYIGSETQEPKLEVELRTPEYVKPINRLTVFYLRNMDSLDRAGAVINDAGESKDGKAILTMARGSLTGAKTGLMLERLSEIKCDALVVRETEYELAERLAEQIDFSIICPAQKKPYVIKDFKRLKVTIISLQTTTRDSLEIYLPELKRKSDLIILLSDMNLEKAKEFAEEVEGIDIIIAAEGENRPVKVGKTIIATGGNFGKLVIFLDMTREIIGYHGKIIR